MILSKREKIRELEARLNNEIMAHAKTAEELENIKKSGQPTLYCSFCGSSQHEVRKLIAGRGAYICNECVVVAVDVCCGRDGGASKKPVGA